jgi:hypothetical protein
MRKIRSAEEIARTQRNNKILIGTILVGLMILSTVGYSLMSNKEDSGSYSKVTEKGIDFYREGDIWRTDMGGVTFRFSYLPSELENVSVTGSYDLGAYYNQPLYLVGPNGAYPEVLNVLGNYVARYQEACISNSSCSGDLPIKSCDSNVIVFSEATETKVYNNQSCVYIEGDIIKGADAFLYKILKI